MNKKAELHNKNSVDAITDFLHVQTESCTPYALESKEPNDGTFMAYDPNDSFSREGDCRYGEVQDADDL